jgi:hypothetical protein
MVYSASVELNCPLALVTEMCSAFASVSEVTKSRPADRVWIHSIEGKACMRSASGCRDFITQIGKQNSVSHQEIKNRHVTLRCTRRILPPKKRADYLGDARHKSNYCTYVVASVSYLWMTDKGNIGLLCLQEFHVKFFQLGPQRQQFRPLGQIRLVQWSIRRIVGIGKRDNPSFSHHRGICGKASRRRLFSIPIIIGRHGGGG